MEKGSLKKVKYKIQNKTHSGKDLIESINIQIEMSYSVSPSLSSTLINLVKKNLLRIYFGSDTVQFNDR